MSYKLYSPRDTEHAHRDIWTDRSVANELQLLRGRTLADDLRSRLPKNARVIEAGCGLGGWVRWLSDEGHDAYGVDFESDTVASVNEGDPSLKVTRGEVTALDFPDAYFDAYISLGVVEHFEEGPQRALAEAYRVLKPGGRAFVTVPFLNQFRRVVAHPMRDLYFAIQRRRGMTPYFWEYRYSADEMKGFVEEQGFEVEAVNIDDYGSEIHDQHIGLYADFFFLRRKGGNGYELNRPGCVVARVVRKASPWATSAGVLVVARKPA